MGTKKRFQPNSPPVSKNLVQLYIETQPILSEPKADNSSALHYIQRVANPGKQAPAFLDVLTSIDQLTEYLPDRQGKAALSHLLRPAFANNLKKLNAIASRELNNLWEESIYKTYKNNIDGHFPSNIKSANDCDPELLQSLLVSSNSRLRVFLENNIFPLLNRTPSQRWTVIDRKGFHMKLNTHSLSQLQSNLNLINALISCSDKSKLCLSLELHPVPNPNLDAISLHLGKVNLSYHNGPETWKSILLNFPQKNQYAALHIKNSNKQDIIISHQSGPYASLHLLSLAHWKCYGQRMLCKLTWNNHSSSWIHVKTSIQLRGILLPIYFNFIRSGIKIPPYIADQQPALSK